MTSTPQNDGAHTDVSPGSMQTLASRQPPPHPDPIATKRVCFYKSGDPQFTGHRMVINSRTFKTFDALLDALSKKVPLPFGVRTITTPRGTHAVRSLDDVQDGASYLCSDQKKVKPFNLDEVQKRQVPWNTTRPVSAGRQARRELVRLLVKRSRVFTRTVKIAESSVVRTPKRVTVYKNRDPSMKRVIVLQRRVAPTFDALLDYLSQVMQFPVLKLYTEDGRRVEGLSGLILCSGIVVAAGNEHFRLGNYIFRSATKTRSRISESFQQTESLLQEKKTSSGTYSRSRNFSLSSEKFLVEQINKSLNGNLHHRTKPESVGTEDSHAGKLNEMDICDCGEENRNCPIMPTEDDIEKSFRVNEDGSMTVEMKVHLTIKQEELIHWTTTLSRTSVTSQQMVVCTSKPESDTNSVDVTNDSGKESNGPHSLDSREINTVHKKSVGFIKDESEQCGSDTSSEKPLALSRRVPTPAPRQRRKQASVENIKTVSETEVQESTMGAYAYMERTAQGELKESYCVVSRSSSSSTRTVTKAGNSEAWEGKHNKSQATFKSSGVAEVLQLQNNGTMGITETVLHIYESQGIYDNYHSNTQVNVDSKIEYIKKAFPQNKPGSTDSGPRSSSHDCDADLTRQSTSSNSIDGGKSNAQSSLSSACSTPPKKMNNNLSTLTDDEKQTLFECTSETTQKKMSYQGDSVKQGEVVKRKDVNSSNSLQNKQSKKSGSSESSGLEKKIKRSSPGCLRENQITSDTVSHIVSQKKISSVESLKLEPKTAKDKNKKAKTFESKNSNPEIANQRRSDKDIRSKEKTIKATSRKGLTNNDEPQGAKLKKRSLENELTAKAIKKLPKQRSMNGVRSKNFKQRQEMSESVSLPVLQLSSSSVNQYVENWLKQIEPESVPYEDETDPPEIVTRAVFQIGGESSDCSEIKSDHEKDSTEEKGPSLEDNIDERLSHPPVQIICEEEPAESQIAKGVCKSMSILGQPTEREELIRTHKSSEKFIPQETSETSQSADLRVSGGMKPVLQQLCVSVQSVKHALSHTHLTSVEKSSSLPDFSSQVASAFGSPSRAVLSFLSLMTLRDGLSILYKNESAINTNIYPEALQVMQSLEKISNIKDEDELKASLTSLHSSTSSKLKQNWKEFQEKNVFGETPPLSPRFSEQEFAVEVDLERDTGEQDKQPSFSIEQLLDELNMPEELHREISLLVEGELKFQNQADKDQISYKSSEEEDDSSSRVKKEAAEVEEENKDSDIDSATTHENITNNPEPESYEAHFNQSHSSKSEKELVHEDSGRTTPNRSLEDTGSEPSKAQSSNSKQVKAEDGENEQTYEDGESEYNDVNSPVTEQQRTDDSNRHLSELSFGQENITKQEDKIAVNIEKQDTIDKDVDTNQKTRESCDSSDVSETDEASAEQSFSDKKAGDDSVGEDDLLDSEAKNCDTGGQYQETKCNLSDGESLREEHFKNSSPQDSEGKNGQKTTETSQEDDGVISPDINDIEDTVMLYSEDDEDDLNEPQCGSEEEHDTIPEVEDDIKQELENDPVDEQMINEVDHDNFEVHDTDRYAESQSQTISDPECVEEDVTDIVSSTHTGSSCDKTYSSAEEHDANEVDKASFNGSQENGSNKESLDRKSVGSPVTSVHQFANPECLGMEHGYHYLLHTTEISQELLDLINSALISSTLTITTDSNGNLRIEPDRFKMREMFLAFQRTNDHYGQKRLPSPNTSDLSDYRPETSENSGYESQEVFTETGGEETERLRIFRDIIKQSSEKTRSKQIAENGSIQSTVDASSPRRKSRSVAIVENTQNPIDDPSCHSSSASNTCSLDGNPEKTKAKINSEGGVLIDKGRWLLKENHLIRNSPPASNGMYSNGDTTSGDTAQDNRSEDLSYACSVTQPSHMAVISSSELEDMVKPPTPKCTYFNMRHSSDSDPLLDAQSLKSCSGEGDARRKRELKVHPMGQSSKVWAKRNGSMSSFASVEFKLSDGKVHPQETSGMVGQRPQSLDSRTAQEEETGNGLNLRCGQHCPIL